MKKKFIEEFTPQLAYWMARSGLTDIEIAGELDIAKSTINKWKKEHPEFYEELKDGKTFIDHLVEGSLLKRALGHSSEEITYKYETLEDGTQIEVIEKKVVKPIAPDVTACIFWLKNRDPEHWRDVKHIDANINKIDEFLEAYNDVTEDDKEKIKAE